MSVIISAEKSTNIKGYPIQMEYPEFWEFLRNMDIKGHRIVKYEIILERNYVYMRFADKTLWQKFKLWWIDMTTPQEETNDVIKSLQPGRPSRRVFESMPESRGDNAGKEN